MPLGEALLLQRQVSAIVDLAMIPMRAMPSVTPFAPTHLIAAAVTGLQNPHLSREVFGRLLCFTPLLKMLIAYFLVARLLLIKMNPAHRPAYCTGLLQLTVRMLAIAALLLVDTTSCCAGVLWFTAWRLATTAALPVIILLSVILARDRITLPASG